MRFFLPTNKRFLKNQDLAGDFQRVELQARVSITWLSFSDFHPIVPGTGKFFTELHRFKTSFYKRYSLNKLNVSSPELLTELNF